MLSAPLLAIGKDDSKPTCPAAGGSLNKRRHIRKIENCAVIKMKSRDFIGSPVVSGYSMLPLQGAQVWSLIGELRSCKVSGMAKKKKKNEVYIIILENCLAGSGRAEPRHITGTCNFSPACISQDACPYELEYSKQHYPQ